jgi:hypothetical protein
MPCRHAKAIWTCFSQAAVTEAVTLFFFPDPAVNIPPLSLNFSAAFSQGSKPAS